MNTKYIKEDKLLVLEITEEIDHHTAENIRRKADYEIQRCMPKKVIFDFSGVTFMDSSGIGMILGRYRILMMLDATLGIVNVKSNIKRIMEMSGLLKIIPIYDVEETETNAGIS